MESIRKVFLLAIMGAFSLSCNVHSAKGPTTNFKELITNPNTNKKDYSCTKIQKQIKFSTKDKTTQTNFDREYVVKKEDIIKYLKNQNISIIIQEEKDKKSVIKDVLNDISNKLKKCGVYFTIGVLGYGVLKLIGEGIKATS